jgi:hypothetical protein
MRSIQTAFGRLLSLTTCGFLFDVTTAAVAGESLDAPGWVLAEPLIEIAMPPVRIKQEAPEWLS